MSRTALEAQWLKKILEIIDKADESSRATIGLADDKYIAHQQKLIEGFTALLAETDTNAVAWTIGVIDDLHINDYRPDTSDKTYKGIKNTLRDRYKTETGIDPAPSYPIKAHLTHPKGDV